MLVVGESTVPRHFEIGAFPELLRLDREGEGVGVVARELMALLNPEFRFLEPEGAHKCAISVMRFEHHFDRVLDPQAVDPRQNPDDEVHRSHFVIVDDHSKSPTELRNRSLELVGKRRIIGPSIARV